MGDSFLNLKLCKYLGFILSFTISLSFVFDNTKILDKQIFASVTLRAKNLDSIRSTTKFLQVKTPKNSQRNDLGPLYAALGRAELRMQC